MFWSPPNMRFFAGRRPPQNLVGRVSTSNCQLAHTCFFRKTGVRERLLGRKNTSHKIFKRVYIIENVHIRVISWAVFLHLGCVFTSCFYICFCRETFFSWPVPLRDVKSRPTAAERPFFLDLCRSETSNHVPQRQRDLFFLTCAALRRQITSHSGR